MTKGGSRPYPPVGWTVRIRSAVRFPPEMPNQPKTSSRGRIPTSLLPWVEARKRHHLSHAHVQIARELGLNPAKLGKIDNHRQQPWKAPLPEFIEHLYFKRFGKERPDVVLSIEEIARKQEEKKAAKREAKRLRRE